VAAALLAGGELEHRQGSSAEVQPRDCVHDVQGVLAGRR
jgi:hypothetical protein